MIVPASLVGLDEVDCLRLILAKRYGKSWYSTYGIRPSKLFDGVDQRLCIHLGHSGGGAGTRIWTTRYHHWNHEERPALFATLAYTPSGSHPRLHRIVQVGS